MWLLKWITFIFQVFVWTKIYLSGQSNPSYLLLGIRNSHSTEVVLLEIMSSSLILNVEKDIATFRDAQSAGVRRQSEANLLPAPCWTAWSKLKLIVGFRIERKAGWTTQVMTPTSYLSLPSSIPLSIQLPLQTYPISFFIIFTHSALPPALSEMKIWLLLIHSAPAPLP